MFIRRFVGVVIIIRALMPLALFLATLVVLDVVVGKLTAHYQQSKAHITSEINNARASAAEVEEAFRPLKEDLETTAQVVKDIGGAIDPVIDVVNLLDPLNVVPDPPKVGDVILPEFDRAFEPIHEFGESVGNVGSEGGRFVAGTVTILRDAWPTLKLLILAIFLWIALCYVSSVYEQMSRGWEMVRGRPDPSPRKGLSKKGLRRMHEAQRADMLAWHKKRIKKTPPFLVAGAVSLDVLYETGATRTDAQGRERLVKRPEERVLLAVLGVRSRGAWEMLHSELAAAENEQTWTAFWHAATERGLDPGAVQLVVGGRSQGLFAAVEACLPQAQLQHAAADKIQKLRSFLDQNALSPGAPEAEQERRSLLADAREIVQAPTLDEAQQRLAAFTEAWEAKASNAVNSFKWGLRRSFTFFDFDRALHPLIRSTALLEPFFQELRSRVDQIGAFPDETSCLTAFHLIHTGQRRNNVTPAL